MGNGVRIICHVDVDIVEALDIFEDQQITDTFLPPGALANSMKSMEENEKKCFSMENVLCGGSLVYTSIRKNFHNYFPKSEMHVVYGATEINVTCSMFHDNKAEDTLSVGILKENVQIKILEDVNGTPLGINEVGEICVKAPDNVCKVKPYKRL